MLLKLISKMKFYLTRLVPPPLVMTTSFDPILDLLITILTGTARLSLSVDVVMGIPI